MSMVGSYREISAPERMVRTESFCMGGEPQGEQVATLDLAGVADATRVSLTLRYATKEARDAVLASSIELGVAASYDRLAILLDSSLVGAK
jgi:hypothetical protein